jgi:cytochrome c peroxidase
MEDVNFRPSRVAWLVGGSVAAIALLCGLTAQAETELSAAASSALRQAQQTPAAATPHANQITPPVIPALTVDLDGSGFVESVQPGGAVQTAKHAFFQNLGTNGRTCFTCHQPAMGWTITPLDAQLRFLLTLGTDPLFAPVDGANCPSANVSNLVARYQASSLLLDKGLIRIGLQLPPTPTTSVQYQIVAITDPHGCNTSAATGLTNYGPSGATTGMVSIYRRPLPSTNLGFLSTVMWDGREASLSTQAVDATTGHAQASTPPTAAQVADIVAFESGVYTAQAIDFSAGSLTDHGGKGGPAALAQQQFFIGINDPLGNNPTGAAFTSNIFNIYAAWPGPSTGRDPTAAYRASVARGEQVFNTKPITITNVAGLNDATGEPSIAGFCGTCHDSPNVGDHSVKAPLNIGVTDADPGPPSLDISGLPVFTIQCNAGPHAGETYTVTDPGRALISGNCADIGKTKGPILRGLASRAPYFHNGSGTTLTDVVNFYDTRFSIGFTAQEKQDLVNFLGTI